MSFLRVKVAVLLEVHMFVCGCLCLGVGNVSGSSLPQSSYLIFASISFAFIYRLYYRLCITYAYIKDVDMG